ncbi:hypothetical protein CLJ1_5460 [Pseudomonas paraeruginosa]|nr:hypothetical protein CLJ1_5460 [Pseudomonas aeruginosa]
MLGKLVIVLLTHRQRSIVRGETGTATKPADGLSGRLLLDYQPTRTTQDGADTRQGRTRTRGLHRLGYASFRWRASWQKRR